MLLLAVIALVLTSCEGCAKSEPKIDDPVTYHDYDGVAQDFTAGVSLIQALHRQTMYSMAANGQAYEWRNSRIIFNDTLTTDAIDNLHVTDVNDVFYYWNSDGPWVQYINTNIQHGVQIPWPINDVWIEDADLTSCQIKISAEDALSRLKAWNGVLPKSCFMTLRLPVGPKVCNAQWVIGDVYQTIFIDAVTGDVSNWNPAFPRK